MLLVPDDNNHTPIQGHQTNTEACWNVFDVDLLASMYPPLAHEEDTYLQASPTIRTHLPHVIQAHEKFLTLQQEFKRIVLLQKRSSVQRAWLNTVGVMSGIVS